MLELVASFLKSAAWPLVVVLGVWLFKEQLRELLASISEFTVTKHGFTGKWNRG
jgi:hypothetical protein